MSVDWGGDAGRRHTDWFRNSLEMQLTAGVGVIGLIGGSLCVYLYVTTGNYPLFVLSLATTVAVMSAIGLHSLHQFVAMRELTERVGEIEDGNLDVDLETDRGDEIGDLYEAVDEMRNALRDSLAEKDAARRDAETARAELEARNERLERHAERFGRVATACAEGDLRQRMDEDVEPAAMRSIATGFNAMLDDLEPMLADVQRFADEVATASERVTERSTDLRESSDVVTERIEGIVAGAGDQREDLEAVTAELEDLSATVEEIASTAETVSERSHEVADRSRTGAASARRSIEAIEEIQTVTDETITAVEALDEEIDRIDEITGVITEIAEQTNVLALNANIETARLDGTEDADLGGIGAVAESVKRLAEDTKAGAQEVTDLVHEIEAKTEVVVEDMERTESCIEGGLADIEDSLSALRDVASLATELDDDVTSVTQATERQSRSTVEVLRHAESVAEISEETEQHARTVADTAAAQSNAIADVADDAATLSGRATHLAAMLARFETEAEAPETPGERVADPADD